MSSLPHGFATWTFDNSVFVQFNISIEIYQGWCAMCWCKKKIDSFIKIHALGFKQVLCGKILSINKSIFCIITYGHYHFGHCNGRQIKHNYNKNLSTKHKWSDVILSIIQKIFWQKIFNHSNKIIVKQLF